MFNPDNDADWDTLALNQASADIANGVCPACDEMLDPTHPRWANDLGPYASAEEAAAILGPHGNVVPGYHDYCVEVME